MDLFEQMVTTVAGDVLGTTTLTYGEHEISLASPWKRQPLRDAILEHSGIDIYEHREQAALRTASLAKFPDLKLENDRTWGQLVDHLLSKFVEPNLIQPTFLTDYPLELSPFARKHRDDPSIVERFECFCAGMEIANAFSELNDPADQYGRFMQQHAARGEGDDTAEQLDEDYITALEYGMPPTGGLGMGIDRFCMLLTGRTSIREVILFPARRTGGSGTVAVHPDADA
jgi:lysyl-tRNA synthetase class 2